MVASRAVEKPADTAPQQLADMHVHLGFIANAGEVAQEGLAQGHAFFCNTVAPQEFQRLSPQPWAKLPNVRLGLGMHPWWVADGRVSDVDVQKFVELVPKTRWIGELGLDFSNKHTEPASHSRQRSALEQALLACANLGVESPGTSQASVPQGSDPGMRFRRVISLHSVSSANEVLDLLESTGCIDSCACVFHWFSGSTPQLWRAIHDGCYFSVNQMQARTRRAKEQLKLVPANRLLLETDMPPGENVPWSCQEITSSLLATCELLAQIRSTTSREVAATTTQNAKGLLR